jgi:hypothetical protein
MHPQRRFQPAREELGEGRVEPLGGGTVDCGRFSCSWAIIIQQSCHKRDNGCHPLFIHCTLHLRQTQGQRHTIQGSLQGHRAATSMLQAKADEN